MPEKTLRALIDEELARPCHPSARALAETIRQRHGASVAAVLFYGSCLRQDPSAAPPEGIQDFYVIVDSFRPVYPGRRQALANYLLPPNVFYIEQPWQDTKVRAKYAVISLDQWRYGTSRRAFHPWLWARFAQPVALLFGRDDEARRLIGNGVVSAIKTMLGASLPLADRSVTIRDLWLLALGQTYRAELRPENVERAALIFENDRDRYERITPIALQALGKASISVSEKGRIETRFFKADQLQAKRRWALRRLVGKPLSVFRLMKSLFTFEGGVDYALWKVERHTGVQVPLSHFERQHPILMSPKLLWRVYRLSAVR